MLFAPDRRYRLTLVVAAAAMACFGQERLEAQQLLDRVVARVDGYAITLTDMRAALALGIIDIPAGAGEQAAIDALVNRQLMRAEIARFAPAEPDPAAVDREVAALLARIGDRLAAVSAATGLDAARIRAAARDTLQIDAYLNQRFGTAAQLTEEDVLQYYRIHPEEFTRDGRLMPFVEAEPAARARAAAERRATAVAQWLQDLRRRADVVIVGGRSE